MRHWGLAIGLIVFAATLLAGAEAQAQNRQDFLFLQDRVQRLEAQLQASSAGGVGGPNAQTAAQLSLRIDQLEAQVRALTGQVEEANFRSRQLEEQLRRFQEDVEFRFRDLQGGGITSIPDPIQQAENQQAGVAPAPGAGLNTDLNAGLAPGTGTLGQLPAEPGAGTGDFSLTDRPLDLSALAGAGQAQGQAPLDAPLTAPLPQEGQTLAVVVPSDPRAEFELGYSLVVTGDYTGAEGVFREFLAQHPGHSLAIDARYWIGESLFSRGAYRDAADSFLAIYTNNKEASVAPPSLLKLAMSLAALNEGQAACATLGELGRVYPNAAPAVAQRAAQEHARLGC